MKGNDQNIEELFQNAFENYETDVNPGMWNNIQSNITQTPSGSTDGGTSSAAGSGSTAVTTGVAGIAKIAAVVGITGSLIAGGLWLSQDEEPIITENQITVVAPKVEEPKTIIKETDPALFLDETNESINTPTENKKENVAKKGNDNLITTDPSHDNVPSNESRVNSATSNQLGDGSNNKDHEQAANQPANGPVDSEVKKEKETNSYSIGPDVKKEEEKELIQPLASINTRIIQEGVPLTVQFTNNDASANNMTWDFGDGSQVSKSYAPEHTFEKTGVFNVILTVQGDDNWVSLDTIVISVSKTISVVIPNVITPNNDGINDVFKVEIDEVDQVKSFRCRVLDRSGSLVYESNNLNGHWNGLDRANNACNVGTYYYVVSIMGYDTPLEVHKGIVTLRR